MLQSFLEYSSLGYSVLEYSERFAMAVSPPVTRFRKICQSYASLMVIGCATTHQSDTVWTNTSGPEHNYVHDSQECEVIANALVPVVANPFLKLGFYKSEWSRCMTGRNWQEVSRTPVPGTPGAHSTPVTVEPRWLQLSRTPELTSYIDTTRIERSPTRVVSVWVRADYSSVQSVERIAFTRMVTRREYDCAAGLTRFTAVAVYDDAGTVLRAEQYPTAQWTSPVPESSDEAMLRGLCKSDSRQ
jgi:hypothetical protein